ncbi:MAG: alpha/beta hydrolase [Pseudomonadota bacterium]
MVVILPFGLRVHVAEPLCARLARDLNVITWQGRSLSDDRFAGNDERLTPESHARDVEALLDWAGNDRCDIIGFCSGAGIALLAAARLADRVERLALVCGEFMLEPAQCPRSSFQQEVDRLLPLAAQGLDLAEMLSEKLSVGRNPSDERSDFEAKLAEPFTTGKHLHRHGLNYIGYRQVDFPALAETVPHPTLLISTHDDQQVFSESSRLIGAALPNLRDHRTFPGDHYEILRADNALTDAVVDFLIDRA